MKKSLLKTDFIELRTQFYTFDEIAKELGISKPTAIKWGKEFADEIEKRQLNSVSGYILGQIYENEELITQRIEQYRRIGRSITDSKAYNRFSKRTFERISNLIHKKLFAISLIINKEDERIDSVHFTFHKNAEISAGNDRYGRKEKRVYKSKV